MERSDNRRYVCVRRLYLNLSARSTESPKQKLLRDICIKGEGQTIVRFEQIEFLCYLEKL